MRRPPRATPLHSSAASDVYKSPCYHRAPTGHGGSWRYWARKELEHAGLGLGIAHTKEEARGSRLGPDCTGNKTRGLELRLRPARTGNAAMANRIGVGSARIGDEPRGLGHGPGPARIGDKRRGQAWPLDTTDAADQ